MTHEELVAWVHEKAAMNGSRGTAAEIVKKIVEECAAVAEAMAEKADAAGRKIEWDGHSSEHMKDQLAGSVAMGRRISDAIKLIGTNL